MNKRSSKRLYQLIFSTSLCLLVVGCGGKCESDTISYSTFIECVVREEQMGGSEDSVKFYCADLARKSVIVCDGNCQSAVYLLIANENKHNSR